VTHPGGGLLPGWTDVAPENFRKASPSTQAFRCKHLGIKRSRSSVAAIPCQFEHPCPSPRRSPPRLRSLTAPRRTSGPSRCPQIASPRERDGAFIALRSARDAQRRLFDGDARTHGRAHRDLLQVLALGGGRLGLHQVGQQRLQVRLQRVFGEVGLADGQWMMPALSVR
jgi:hypothetical protein